MLIDDLLSQETQINQELNLEQENKAKNSLENIKVDTQRVPPFYCFKCKHPTEHTLDYQKSKTEQVIYEVLSCDSCGVESRVKLKNETRGFPYY